jgi:hypothetical protein
MTAEEIRGASGSTYVRTTVCINNTYIHTDALATNTLEIAEFATGEINAYSFSGVHPDAAGGR